MDGSLANGSSHANAQRRPKPEKPHPQFPLFAHRNGQWAKKIRNRLHYFGSWADPEGAVSRYLAQKDALHAGYEPSPDSGAVTVREVINAFLTVKNTRLKSGEITPRTFADYQDICFRVAKRMDAGRAVASLNFGDFERLRTELSKTRGHTALANDITRIRMIFKFAYDSGMIAQPVQFGQAMKKPSKHLFRAQRRKQGQRMFSAEQLSKIIDAADDQMTAMVLLGINCGFGNRDCGLLPISALDLKTAWVNFPRPKTGAERRCPLWSETVAALRSAIDNRPAARDPNDEPLVFLTSKGQRWAKEQTDNPISKEMRKLLIELGLYRKGVNFYALRHTFETIAGESKDQVAVDHIMGHARDDMASVYREKISDQRLVDVAQFVHDWLYAAPETAG
ncbi:MAG: tyrosine-type recombinase/integrase [Pirellulales bacterium]